MAGNKSSMWKQLRQEQRNRNLLLAIIPLIVITLVIVIWIVGRADKKNIEIDTGSATEIQTEENIENTAATEMVEEGGEEVQLSKDEIPAINALLEAYCKARETCDAETIYQLYGRTDTTGMDKERERMLLNARYIQSFKNVVCYTTEALEENSWLVYTSVDIKFYKAETLAPMVMWSYVSEQEDGTFFIMDPESLTPEQQDFINASAKSEDARNLALQVNTRLAEAVAADPDLASIYNTLNAGSPLWKTEETEETETQPEVQILPE